MTVKELMDILKTQRQTARVIIEGETYDTYENEKIFVYVEDKIGVSTEYDDVIIKFKYDNS